MPGCLFLKFILIFAAMKNDKHSETTINILPDFIANQIAAGEVVQRPQSVVKELVENAIDAGADTIAVIIRQAGKQLIHVVDNGSGMNDKDLLLSTKRHATSKIKTQNDLEEILTYGFRGEALASISSVASLEIRTKRNDDELGWKLTAEPNREQNIEPAANETGTQVFVKNLFYNVPARRKFLKSNLTEFRHISDTMTKFALSNPDKRFTFYDGDTLIFDLFPSTPEQRIRDAIGPETTDSLIKLGFENKSMKIYGYLGNPVIAKNNRSGQFLFMNGRSIISRSLSHAIYKTLEKLIDKDRHPVYIINIDIDPKRVDVNVHPQKNEVKFDDEQYIYNCLTETLNKALQAENLTPDFSLAEFSAKAPFFTEESAKGRIAINRETGEIIDNENEMPRAVSSSSFTSPRPYENDSYRSPIPDRDNFGRKEQSAYDAIFGGKKDSFDEIPHTPTTGNRHEIDIEIKQLKADIWQLRSRYLLLLKPDSITLVDKRAAHIRILYERSLKNIEGNPTSSQELLFPERITLSPVKFTILNEILTELNSIGFFIDLKNDNSVEISAIPSDLNSGAAEKALGDIIDSFEKMQGNANSSRKEKIAESFAVRSAIRDDKILGEKEAESLIKELLQCSNPYRAPNGRRIMMELQGAEIDKIFK